MIKPDGAGEYKSGSEDKGSRNPVMPLSRRAYSLFVYVSEVIR